MAQHTVLCSVSLPRISWWSARLFSNGWMGKLEVAHTGVIEGGFRRISMAISQIRLIDAGYGVKVEVF